MDPLDSRRGHAGMTNLKVIVIPECFYRGSRAYFVERLMDSRYKHAGMTTYFITLHTSHPSSRYTSSHPGIPAPRRDCSAGPAST
jgi:hypothetical protein